MSILFMPLYFQVDVSFFKKIFSLYPDHFSYVSLYISHRFYYLFLLIENILLFLMFFILSMNFNFLYQSLSSFNFPF